MDLVWSYLCFRACIKGAHVRIWARPEFLNEEIWNGPQIPACNLSFSATWCLASCRPDEQIIQATMKELERLLNFCMHEFSLGATWCLASCRPDEEIIQATMKELERLFPNEIRADQSMAKVHDSVARKGYAGSENTQHS